MHMALFNRDGDKTMFCEYIKFIDWIQIGEWFYI